MFKKTFFFSVLWTVHPIKGPLGFFRPHLGLRLGPAKHNPWQNEPAKHSCSSVAWRLQGGQADRRQVEENPAGPHRPRWVSGRCRFCCFLTVSETWAGSGASGILPGPGKHAAQSGNPVSAHACPEGSSSPATPACAGAGGFHLQLFGGSACATTHSEGSAGFAQPCLERSSTVISACHEERHLHLSWGKPRLRRRNYGAEGRSCTGELAGSGSCAEDCASGLGPGLCTCWFFLSSCTSWFCPSPADSAHLPALVGSLVPTSAGSAVVGADAVPSPSDTPPPTMGERQGSGWKDHVGCQEVHIEGGGPSGHAPFMVHDLFPDLPVGGPQLVTSTCQQSDGQPLI